MKINGDKLIFSSGNTVTANCGVIGLSPSGEVTEGWDGGLWNPGMIPEDSPLWVADRIELAEYMAEQWAAFGQQARNEALGITDD